MNWRIEETRWITAEEKERLESDLQHKVTVINTDEQMSTVYYYVTIVSYQNHTYEQLTSVLLREKYDLNGELAILRQRDTKPEEFNAYNTFAEECKVKAQQMIKEREDFYASLVPEEPSSESVEPVEPTIDPVM